MKVGKINFGRVVAGGLVAGLIINVAEITSSVVFADWYAQVFQSLGIPPMGPGAMISLVLGSFVLGIIAVWTYAAMRPRFGPGPGTAMTTGLVVWVLGWFWQMVVDVATGLYAPTLWMWVVGSLWTFVEVELATLAGAALYREEPLKSSEPSP